MLSLHKLCISVRDWFFFLVGILVLHPVLPPISTILYKEKRKQELGTQSELGDYFSRRRLVEGLVEGRGG